MIYFRKAALTKLSGDRQKYEYFCGGVLIDQQTVLTGTKQVFVNLPFQTGILY